MDRNPSVEATGRSFLVVALSLLSASCEPARGPDANPIDLADVRTQVTEATWAFHAADTARDAEAVIALLWPEYEMLVDGQRTNYEAVAAGSHDFMASLEVFHTVWSDLQVIPLGPDLALSSFSFRDSIVAKSGEVTLSQGPTTFVWERRNGEWRLRFGDADHYPLQAERGAR